MPVQRLSPERRAELKAQRDALRRDYAARAITIPILKPVEGTWADLGADLNDAFTVATRLANWMLRQCAQADPLPPPGEKLAKYTPLGMKLYHGAAALCPDLPRATVNLIQRDVERKYCQVRLDIARGKVSLPSLRWPQPYPIRDGAWKPELDAAGNPVVTMQIAHTRRGQPWRLQLKRGRDFRRQYRVFERMARGELRCGTAAILRTARGPSVKMIVWLPKQKARGDADDVLVVRTHPRALLVARLAGRTHDAWRLNGDDILRRVAAERGRRQRLSEDAKHELRARRGGVYERLRRVAEAEQRWRATRCQQIAAAVAGLAARRRCRAVWWDDAQRDFLPTFAYYQIKRELAARLELLGIELRDAAAVRAAQARAQATAEALAEWDMVQRTLAEMVAGETQEEQNDERDPGNGDYREADGDGATARSGRRGRGA